MQLSQTVTWIPIAEKLPEEGSRVMIASTSGRRYVGFHYKGEWTFSPHSSVETPLRDAAAYWMQPILHPDDIPQVAEQPETELFLVRAEMAAVERLHSAQNEVLARKSQTITALEAEIAALKAEIAAL